MPFSFAHSAGVFTVRVKSRDNIGLMIDVTPGLFCLMSCFVDKVVGSSADDKRGSCRRVVYVERCLQPRIAVPSLLVMILYRRDSPPLVGCVHENVVKSEFVKLESTIIVPINSLAPDLGPLQSAENVRVVNGMSTHTHSRTLIV